MSQATGRVPAVVRGERATTSLPPPVPIPAWRRAARRVWAAPLGAHLAALALVLLALVPFVGTSASFLSDEGAAVIQARSLAAGRGWIVAQPLPSVDPSGAYYPLVNAAKGSRGFAPLAKHPAYSVLLAGAGRVGGVPAMVVLSLAGTVAAAAVAGALADRLDPVLSRPAVWAVGLASPLLFDGFLVMGHSVAAALAGAAVLCAVVAVEKRRPAIALGVAPCIAGAVLLRSEALLFAVSLAGVTAVLAFRKPRAAAAVATVSAAGAAIAARAIETAWLGRIVGGRPPVVAVPAPVRDGGFLPGRLDAFRMTWLLPDYRAAKPLTLLLLGVAAGLALAAVAARGTEPSPRRVLFPAALAAVASVASLFAAPPAVVPGLLIAFPLMVAGLVVLRRALFRDVGAACAGATSGLFALAVIATQYPTGGTGEWGGRYFALAIPVVVPVLLLALHNQARALAPPVARGALLSLVVCSTVLASTAVLSLRSSHRFWSQFTADVAQAEAVAGTGRPVVTTWSAAPRYAWPIFDSAPWLLAPREQLADLRTSLARSGFDRFVFVTVDIDRDQAALAGLDVIWSKDSGARGRRIVVVAESGRPG